MTSSPESPENPATPENPGTPESLPAAEVATARASVAEAFFVNGQALQAEHPRLYALLSGYFQQDPAAI